MTKSYEPVSFDDVEVLQDSGKAICVRVDDKEVWIPKTLIHDDSEVYKEGTEGTLVIPEWLAIEKELV